MQWKVQQSVKEWWGKITAAITISLRAVEGAISAFLTLGTHCLYRSHVTTVFLYCLCFQINRLIWVQFCKGIISVRRLITPSKIWRWCCFYSEDGERLLAGKRNRCARYVGTGSYIIQVMLWLTGEKRRNKINCCCMCLQFIVRTSIDKTIILLASPSK